MSINACNFIPVSILVNIISNIRTIESWAAVSCCCNWLSGLHVLHIMGLKIVATQHIHTYHSFVEQHYFHICKTSDHTITNLLSY